MTDARLRDLAARIERIVIAPSEVSAPLTRLARPILRAVGWQPRVEIGATRALLAEIRDALASGRKSDSEAVRSALGRALDELEANVTAVERACVVNRRSPFAHATWLGRLLGCIARASEAIASGDELALRLASGARSGDVLAPLAAREAGESPSAPDPEPNSAGARLLELQLAAVDRLLDAARDETGMLGRRRRVLEAARQLLLELSAALPLERAGVRERHAHIAREICSINRIQAAGLAPEVGILHQARQAVSRAERRKLGAALVALDAAAVARGDGAMASLTRAALRAARIGVEADPGTRARALELSASEVLGDEVSAAIRDSYGRLRKHISRERRRASAKDREYYDAAGRYAGAGAELAAFASALSADGLFEVGGGLVPARVVEQARCMRAVRYPTADLVLLPARDVRDLPDAIIEDPRLVLLHLAEGKLLARRFAVEEVTTHERTVMLPEVRVYVLDGSGSMIGPRARMRDAILLCELATLLSRLRQKGKSAGVVLFYRYFDEGVEATRRLDAPEEALEAIEHVLGTVRAGGTDIQGALLASFQQVREARQQDPELARAQIVLVTDGEAEVDAEAVRAAREALGDFPVAMSVIALGRENPALCAIVAHQRARGERAFYHFIDDETLADISRGEGQIVLESSEPDGLDTAADLDATLSTLLDQMETLDRRRDIDALESLEHERVARRELGVLRDTTPGTTGKARLDALQRDVHALRLHYAHCFPPPNPGATSVAPEGGTRDAEELETVRVALATVAEVVDLVGGSPLARRADAIEILERLLPDARLQSVEYQAVLATYPAQLADALAAVHRAVEPAGRARPAGTADEKY